MSKVVVLDTKQLEGIGMVLTEMVLQGWSQEDVADIIRPMGISVEEIHHLLEYVDPKWEENEVWYLVDLYFAWVEASHE